MANLNRVFLMGNLTRDPELRYTPGGTAVTNLRMAVNRRYRTQAGELKEETAFITVVTWGKQAEACTQFLTKGKPVFVEGRLQMRSWETPEGQKRNMLEVRASRVQFLGKTQTHGESVEVKEEESLEALLNGDSRKPSVPAQSSEAGSNEVPF
jgi:single-strand DNA-binding protein